MKQPTGTARSWGIATILVAVLLLVAAWFLLISPVLASAAETREDTEAQEAQNEISRQEVEVLKAEFARMPEYELQLAALQEQITTTQRYADLQRLVAAIADEHEVVVTSLSFGTAEEVEQPVPPAPAEPVEGEETDEEATDEEPAPAEPVATGISGLFSIAVSIEFDGEYTDVLAAVRDLQTGENRIVLINVVNLTSAANGESGDDATVATLEGQTFVLADVEELAAEDAPTTEPEEEPSAEPTPLPQSSENPLVAN
ncbi:hypothetical protein [Demequina sp. NBRC 110056]|uniref:hypothetical protein n=1 Tax=Demequina sp. NBRC 110056 TaxID=1570345 RepID=UPI000A0143B9|nr:hypothetical protein [Demequina sp. NBRC 110056]